MIQDSLWFSVFKLYWPKSRKKLLPGCLVSLLFLNICLWTRWKLYSQEFDILKRDISSQMLNKRASCSLYFYCSHFCFS